MDKEPEMVLRGNFEGTYKTTKIQQYQDNLSIPAHMTMLFQSC